MVNSEFHSHSVCLLAVYFGPLPPWFPLWVRTCGANASFDWILFTDTSTDQLPLLPRNIKVINISFSEIKLLIQERLEMEVCLPRPYKLCDFRAAYGVIFAKWLEGYDFWGYCDIDIVWGDLQSFFTDEVFSSFDKIQESGHLSFYRNIERVNTLYLQPAPNVSYKDVFKSPRNFSFDEHGGVRYLTYLKGLSHIWITKYFDANPAKSKLADCRNDNYRRQILYWEDGHLYREFVDGKKQSRHSYEYPEVTRDEYAYIHLQQRRFPAPAFDIDAVRGFYITPFGFSQKIKYIHGLEDFIRLNPRSLTYKPWMRTKVFIRRMKLSISDWLS